jgi:enamine deaminase RidA (YjgF/YER057c/UK114 family)
MPSSASLAWNHREARNRPGPEQHVLEKSLENEFAMKIYNPETLGAPLGQYSHVTRVKARELIFVAGMLSPGDDFETQCAGVFQQIEMALKSADAGWENVVQFTTYLVHSQDIPKFMTFRLREFPKMFVNRAYPPNTLLTIDRLVHEKFLVEVQTIAAL